MKRALNIVLLLIILMAACLIPMQHSIASHGNTAQLTEQSVSYESATSEIQSNHFKNNPPTFLTFLFVLFILLLYKFSPPQASLKIHSRSFIPTLRLQYLLNPIQFKSKFIG